MRNFPIYCWIQIILGFLLFQYAHSDCLLPDEDFLNGEVKFPTNFIFGNETFISELAILQFTCFEGYLRIGPEYIQCEFDNWTDTVPFCAGMRCSDPPDVEGANYNMLSVTNDLTVGALVQYLCKDGYELKNKNASTLLCVLNIKSDVAVWEGELPICKERKSCPEPGMSNHGERTGNCCMSGNILHYYCKRGYKLEGDRELRCLPSGNWTSTRPLCKPFRNYCQHPPFIQNGVVTGRKTGDYFVHNEEAFILCKPGYKVIGNSASVCKRGNWTKQFGTCKEIFCEPPKLIEHGTIPKMEIYNLTMLPYDFEITYVCDKGYRIYSGDSWRTCTRRGWSGKTPRCEVKRCPDPGTPDNGLKEGSNYTVGSTVRFGCFQGFSLLGSFERYCMPNGKWNGKLARCNIETNYCPDPGTPIRGSKNMTEYKKGDRVRFRCEPGYMLIGSEIRECLPDKTWSGKETKCLSQYDYDDELEVSDIIKAKVAEKARQQKMELEKYEAARFSVDGSGFIARGRMLDLNYPGRIILYFVFDVSSSIGKTNFDKSVDFAKAIVRKVGISRNGARAAALTFSSEADLIFWPMTFNTTEQVLDAMNKINFTGGGTAASPALNALRKKHIPLVKEWVKDADIKHVIFILTDGKANMGGDPKKEADLLKANGVEIFCIGITGDLKQKVLFDIASVSKYGRYMEDRPNVFILENYDKLAWLVQEITNGTIDYSVCGIGEEPVGVNRGRIVGGDVSTQPWPWMAALYMVDGNEVPPQWNFKCGGSIIHPRFILTAAHCLFNKTYSERQPNEITVKLGLTVLSNKTYLQEFDVRKIYIHDQYSHRKSYDYDIALLELKRPIVFEPYIRPICLPPKVIPNDSELYRPQAIVYVPGWGHTEVKEKLDYSNPVTSRVLKEIALPIQNRSNCLASIKDEIPPLGEEHFTPRMFCAGEGLGEQDTCEGDSGGPVMQSFKNDEGYPSWTQVGIVSWGLGCGLQSEYGFYTHLVNLMPWVEEKLENALKRMS